MNISQLFKSLEGELSKKKPLFKGGNGDALRLLLELKAKVGEEIDRLSKLNSSRGELMRNADIKAKGIVDEALKRSDEIIMRTDYVRCAEDRAEQVLRDAMEQKNDVMNKLAGYLSAKMYECERVMEEMLSQIKHDRAKLFDNLSTD